MSYVIRTEHGQTIVIDGGVTGDAAYLKGFLAALGNEVAAWFITHAHDDHFGALSQLLGAADAPRIKAIYGSLPDLAWVTARGVGPQDAKPYEQFLEALRKANQTIADLALGQEMTIDGLRLEVLGVRNLEITNNAINNSSLVLRASDKAKSILFTADLGVEGGRKLLNSPYAKRLPADYLHCSWWSRRSHETFRLAACEAVARRVGWRLLVAKGRRWVSGCAMGQTVGS